MSASKVPPDAAGDGGACCSCLLAQLLRHLSDCLSSVALSLSPSSPIYHHTSALPLLFDRLLLAFPSQHQQQHPHHQHQQHSKQEGSHRVFASSLLQLDILRLLLLIADDLRVLLLTVAESYGDDTHDISSSITATREEVGLLDGREVCVQDTNCCLERLFPFFRKRIVSVQKETMNAREIDGKELGKRFMEAVSDLQKYSDLLELTCQNLTGKLSSTVELITSRLTSSQRLTSCATTSLLRTSIRSFLYGGVEPPLNFEHADPASLYWEEWLVKKAEVVIERLLNPRGPSIVGIGGGSGLGKTCVASQVASDGRIAAIFPGGVLYLSVGREPDLTSLQAILWRRMWGGSIYSTSSKATFSSPEEGTAALLSRVQEWLPCLVVLDDVWDAAHVRPFMCFDGKDKGRILVISHVVRSVLAEWEGDTSVHVLEPLEEEEATCLFNSIAAYPGLERVSTMEVLRSKCAGVPRLIQAAASILYYEKARAFTSPSVISFLKQGVIVDLNARPPTKKMTTSAVTDHGEAKPKQQDIAMSSLSEAANWNLLVFFDALAEVHPGLQECFLDLAAFPKGKWVSLSMLVDVWSFGDGMEKERVLFVLSFLASRSLIEWKVEESLDGELNKGFSFQWRLAGEFYELAQALIERRLKETSEFWALNSGNEKNVFGRCEQGMDTQVHDVNGMLNLLQSAVEAFDVFTGLQANCKTSSGGISVPCCVLEHSNLRLDDIRAKITFASRRGPVFFSGRSFQGDCRLFIPGWNLDPCAAWWNQGNLSNKVTKLSLISGSMAEVPCEVEFSNLKVALLSSNLKLKSIPASTLKCMEQLVVLDLKQCVLLTSLPDSICTLQCLELLDLSSCTHLITLPQSIGKLRFLRFLRLSGCLSLSCLPMSLGSLSNLVMLDLSTCVRLKSLPRTLGHLSCLQILNLSGCYSLQCLPASMALLRKLMTLVVSGCSNLSYTPPWFDLIMIMAGWRKGGGMAIPLKLWKLGQIEVLHLGSLKNLTYLPQSVGKLQHLRHLNLSSCRALDSLPDDLGLLFLLEKLDLSHTAIRKLPTTMGQLSSLVTLCLRGCSRLLCIPPSVCALPKLEFLEMAECWDFVMLPVEFGSSHSMPKLIELDLSGCSIKQLPCFTKGALCMLQKLHLSGCQNLSSLPVSFGTLTSLEKIDLEGCKSLASLQGIGLPALKQLQWLNLRNCLTLGNLPVSEMKDLQSLKFLDVSGCTKLSPFPEPLLQCARDHRFTLVRWGAIWH